MTIQFNRMKGLFLFVALLTLLVSCNTQRSISGEQVKNHVKEKKERQGWDDANIHLYGDIDSVWIMTYAVTEELGKIKKGDLVGSRIVTFNQAGDVMEKVDYTIQVDITSFEDGKMVRRDTIKYGPNEVWSTKVICSYNEAGKLIEERCHYPEDSEELDTKYIFTYDSVGNLIEKAYYEPRGFENEKYTYAYDSVGNKIEAARYDASGVMLWKDTNTYDSFGKRIKYLHYIAPGSIYVTMYPIYDADGREIGNNYYSDDVMYLKSTITYDSAGNMIEHAVYSVDGELYEKFTYAYDTANNKIEEAQYRCDGKLTNKTKYTYDSYGNVIQSIEYNGENVKPINLREYTITYR